MSEDEAKKLVRDAIAGGILHDMGSGSNVDICVIKANDKIEYIRWVIIHIVGWQHLSPLISITFDFLLDMLRGVKKMSLTTMSGTSNSIKRTNILMGAYFFDQLSWNWFEALGSDDGTKHRGT